jgi:hypothetical protein
VLVRISAAKRMRDAIEKSAREAGDTEVTLARVLGAEALRRTGALA